MYTCQNVVGVMQLYEESEWAMLLRVRDCNFWKSEWCIVWVMHCFFRVGFCPETNLHLSFWLHASNQNTYRSRQLLMKFTTEVQPIFVSIYLVLKKPVTPKYEVQSPTRCLIDLAEVPDWSSWGAQLVQNYHQGGSMHPYCGLALFKIHLSSHIGAP